MSPCCRRFTRCDRTAARRRAGSRRRSTTCARSPTPAPKVLWSKFPRTPNPSIAGSLHMFDTIKGSDWLGDQDAIEIMIKDAHRYYLRIRAHGLRVQPHARRAHRAAALWRAQRARAPTTPPTGPDTSCCTPFTNRRSKHGVKFYSEWYCARSDRRGQRVQGRRRDEHAHGRDSHHARQGGDVRHGRLWPRLEDHVERARQHRRRRGAGLPRRACR